MIIACPACATRYAVPDDAIGIEGRTVRCAKCRHSWFQEGPERAVAVAPAASAPVAAAAPEPRPAAPAAQAQSTPSEAVPAARTAPPYGYDDEGETAPPVPNALAARTAPLGDDDAESEPAQEEETRSDWDQDDEQLSPFDHTAPFRPRRNVGKLLMIASIIFALVVLGATAWVWRYGLPGWVPATSTTFAEAQPELVLDFPPNRQDRRTLPNGTEFFGASGTVTNVGSAERSLPSILVVMRDARERIVYRWEVIPPKRRLAPGESVTINEAVTDVPKSAVAAEIGWKPG